MLQGDLGDLALPEMKVDLAQAGRLAGTGGWRDGRLEVTVDTTALNLRGLEKRLNETRLAGRVALAGGAARQEMRLSLGEKDYRFHFAGALDDGVLKVSEAFARAGRSKWPRAGVIALDEQRAFVAQRTVDRVRPGAVRQVSRKRASTATSRRKGRSSR